jgi:SGNH hydrolase-like domain, acetyltransferase AlgX/RTX calcium-binding nonapeptide repeat (4 copies)
MAEPTPDLHGHWRRLIGGTALAVVAAFALPTLLRAPNLQENRALASSPQWPQDTTELAGFRAAVDAFVADHFPPRAHLIGGLNGLRMALGASGSSRVIVGQDGWLYYDDGTHLGAARGDPLLPDAELRNWLSALSGRSVAAQRAGATYVVLIAPTKEAIYPWQTPDWFHLDANRAAVALSRLAEKAGVGDVVYPAAALTKQARWGLQVYSPHDTHWTGLGAYFGYAALMQRLADKDVAGAPRPLEAFTEVRINSTIKPRDLALMLGVASFSAAAFPEFGDPLSERRSQTQYLSADRSWTGPRVIETGAEGKPILLITTDSFSTALLPLLYADFSRIVVAHNRDGDWRPDLMAAFHPDVVVLEVAEGGARRVMQGGPEADAAAAVRIDTVVRERGRHRLPATPDRESVRVCLIDGSDRNDQIKGDKRPDAIHGRAGNDALRGLAGDDSLRGGRGDDVLDAGLGDDWLAGERGDDTLTGGAGADIFSVGADAGADLVLDFSGADGDRVEIFDGSTYSVRQEGGDTIVQLARGRVILRGVRADGLPQGWIYGR